MKTFTHKFLMILLVIVLGGCSMFPSLSGKNENFEKWQQAGISDYRYKVFVGCFCPFWEKMPLTIEVRDGQVISITASNGDPIPDYELEMFNRYAGMDSIFQLIEEAQSGDADKITVSYDETYGYPVKIDIDYIELAIDDELTLEISDLEILQ